MDIQDLEILQDVARRLSFTSVAEARGVAPSSISRAIGHLETELGLKLFQRTTRRMVLTEAGARFCDRLEDLLMDFDRAVDEARGVERELRGRLRLTASIAFGEAILMPLLVEFRSLHPGIKLEVQLTDARIDLVGEGIDLAIRLGDGPSGDGICVKLMDTRYHVVAAPAALERRPTPDHPKDLAGRPDLVSLTLPGFRDAWRFRDASGEESLIPIAPALQVSSPAGLKAAVLAGAGIGLLADWQIGSELETGELASLFGDFAATATSFETAAYALYPARRHLPAKVRAMLDFLKARIR
ncbi:MAG: LysR substrate-binding domain-containing protein [Magnetovibrionaceae bacterium]